MEIVALLENIRSAHNVGAFFRTGDGAGVKKLYLLGYTPAPKDRFGRVREDMKKTSLGATVAVPYESSTTPEVLIKKLQEEGFEIVAVEQTERSIPYMQYVPKGKKVAFIFGNEVEGVSDDLLERADTHIEIPMSGKKESLNVSVCGGVVLFFTRDFSTR